MEGIDNPVVGDGRSVVTNAHEAPMAEEGAVAHEVPFEDICVVIVAARPQPKRLAKWARRWAEDPDLSRSPVVVLCREQDVTRFDPVTAELPGVTLRVLPSANGDQGEQTQKLQDYADIFDRITSPWFCFSTLPRRFGRYSVDLKARIAKEYARVRAIDLTSDRAILLHNRQRDRSATRAYVWHTLSRLGPRISPALRDYVGYLALASGTHKLEGVDLRAETQELELFARVTAGRFNTETQPSWRYRFAVVSPQRQILTERPAVLQQRLDNQGGRHWENLVGRLPLDDIPEGNHRLMVGIDSPYAALRSVRQLQPRPGVLAPARTILARSRTEDVEATTQTRYLVHTVQGSRTWITLQRGTGSAALRRWTWTMLKKDARQILKGRGGRRMRLARLVRLVTRPYFRAKSPWLIGERADTAQDNGYHLFRHLRQAHPGRRAYYIIDRNSPQYDRVRDMGNVIPHSSVRHRLLMMHATVLANAYSIKHMIPRQWTADGYTRILAWRVGAERVYLKHGVHVSPTAVKRGTGGYDLYLSVNHRESAALKASSGYRDQVVETGMPRYDTLVPGPSTRMILFMPTWRRYLVPKLFGPGADAQVSFEGSTYEQFIHGLLTSPRLHDILTRYDYRLQLLPHYNLRQELEHFELTSDRTEFADTVRHSFQDLIRGCDAFVTDYSSVHFDVAYLGTPIIYTHFDREEYERGHAVVSWFDHETDGFGPVVHTVQETLDALEELLSRGCAQDPAFASRIDEAFTFHDHNNCERVVTEIDRLVQRARTGG